MTQPDFDVLARGAQNAIAAIITDSDRAAEAMDDYLALDTSDAGTHLALYALGAAVGIMWRKTDSLKDSDFFGLSVDDGVEPDPHRLFAARWVTASMNQDMDTCTALYLAVPHDRAGEQSIGALIDMLIGALREIGRAFLQETRP